MSIQQITGSAGVSEYRHESASERRAWILTQLRQTGFLSITDLARELRVSSMTVRRDLHALESRGEARLVHGGASLPLEALRGTRQSCDAREVARHRVASRAAALVGSTDDIAIDAGPTGYALACALPECFAGSVITHSMPVLRIIAERAPRARLLGLGGELSADRDAFVGPDTEAALSGLRARTLFLEPAAVDARGVYARSAAEANLQRALMDIVDATVVIATPDVLAGSAPAVIAPLQHISRFVTDGRIAQAFEAALRTAGVVIEGPATGRR